MAKAELEYPIATIRGKMQSDSTHYYTQRNGKTVVSHYPKHKDPKKISQLQRTQQMSFQTAVRQATIEMADPDRRAYWQQRFTNNPQKYKTLRGYIIASLQKA